jgi:signal transduction histidine kinase
MEALAPSPPLSVRDGRFRRLMLRTQAVLPRGQTLPKEEWERRHRLLLRCVWLQVPALAIFSLAMGYNVFHTFLHIGAIAGLGAAASLPLQSQRTKACLVALGLLTGAAIAVHAAHGSIEAHFYFFVVLVALTLYEDWIPLIMAVGYTAVHHAVLGTLDRSAVYDHGGSPLMWAGIHAAFVLAATGAAVVAWSLNEDVRAAQKRAEEERVEAEAESGRLKSEFFALVSHELRTPLTSIIGYLDILQETATDALGENGRRSVDVIGRNTKRLERLVEDLLLLTQVDAGTFRVEPVPTCLRQIAQDAIEAMTPRAETGGVELTLDMAELPLVSADASRVAQVLDNLLSNSIKFTPPGGRIDLRVHREGHQVAIEVQDTGTGISPEELEHVFDRFFRAAEALSNHIQGVGLGLAITKVIVESHGGTISLHSEEGKGTLVRLLLPMGDLSTNGHAPVAKVQKIAALA